MNLIRIVSSLLTILFASTLLFSSCATIAHGTRQQISITTSPAGATVSCGDQSITSPGSIELTRTSDHMIQISKPGHKTEVVAMTRVVSGALAGNIILPGGLLGVGIDVLTGAQWEFETPELDLQLQPLIAGETDTAAQSLTVLEELTDKHETASEIYVSLKKMSLKSERIAERG